MKQGIDLALRFVNLKIGFLIFGFPMFGFLVFGFPLFALEICPAVKF